MTPARRTPPGRAGRLRLRHSLDVAERGADLLERKLRILRAEHERLLRAEAAAGRTWRELLSEAETWLLRGLLLGGEQALGSAAAGIAPAEVTVRWSVFRGCAVRHRSPCPCRPAPPRPPHPPTRPWRTPRPPTPTPCAPRPSTPPLAPRPSRWARRSRAPGTGSVPCAATGFPVCGRNFTGQAWHWSSPSTRTASVGAGPPAPTDGDGSRRTPDCTGPVASRGPGRSRP